MIKSSALSALLKQAVAQGTHDSRYCLINVGGVLSNYQIGSAILKEKKLKYLVIENEIQILSSQLIFIVI